MTGFVNTSQDNKNTIYSLSLELSGDDILSGDLGRDLLVGFDGNDLINGDADDDTLKGGNGDDTIYGGTGDDDIHGDDDNDLIWGHRGNDTLKGGAGNDHIHGGKGNDLIWGHRGNDTLKGGAGDDHIHGGEGKDFLRGHEGNDTLKGGAGDDHIHGDDGNDFLRGHEGNDTLKGGAGDDHIHGDEGNDLIRGHRGNDTLKGGAGDDHIHGGNGHDVLWGHRGNDTLKGGAGDDHIHGGKGHDVLWGHEGNDTLVGGAGNDIFVLTSDSGFDHILDFKVGEDKIRLENGLTYSDLKMVSSGHTDTVIKNQVTGEHLAKLYNVAPEDIKATDFDLKFEYSSLDGSGNNLLDVNLGKAGNIYRRVGDANYLNGDDINDTLPNARYVSNRVFNDLHINLFSENNASHLVFVWGQFLDHTFGLARGGGDTSGIGIGGGEVANIAFDNNDPLEEFQNDFGVIEFTRSDSFFIDGQREQINSVSSFIDGWAIYGGTEERLEWMREGPVDGDMSNNSAKLLLPGNYLPTADARGDVANAPAMDLMSRLRNDPASAVIAGDVRASENNGLTAMHTLFAREHNRVVDLLPEGLEEETKFQIARKVVIAKQQYITYNEYLPSIGIELDPYQGYDPDVDPSLTNEFATVGYRAHSMVHGDFDYPVRNLSDADIAMLEAQGALKDGDVIEVPVNTQSGNPSVVNKVGLGAVIESLFETNYNNDVQIDNQLRSILFQIPVEGGEFTDGPPIENLFNGVVDIGAIDVQRGRDHGMPSYNDLREDFGLPRLDSFYDITGEDPKEIAAFVDAEDLKNVDGSIITSADLIFDAQDIDLNDPSIIDFIAVLDEEGEVVADPQEIADLLADNQEVEGIFSIQRSTVAARMEAIYGDIDNLDAFTGMIAEEHIPGTEFGELQYTIWKEQFEDLRDGDRFFYLNDQDLGDIKAAFGIDYQHSFRDIIALNTDLEVGDIFENVFITEAHA
ncbi:MAG: peroxidase family protein [Cyanobacteria bacterium P01_A01_bin.83]